MAWWNKNYFIQNIKKSKNILLFAFGFMTLLNGISFYNTVASSNPFLLTIEKLSSITIFGVFFLPILLSMTLFNYIYKKTSIDFTASLPLSRKTIFFTNTVAGFTIIFLFILVNTLLLGLITGLSPGVIYSPYMFIDYFIIFLVLYFFLFTVSNLALSLGGNKITQIALILLIVFFVPFLIYTMMYLYERQLRVRFSITTFANIVHSYSPYSIITNGIASLVLSGLYGSFTLTSMHVLWTLLLSILYFFIGSYFFKKKEFEYFDTSFKSPKVHLLVQALTLSPLALFLFLMFIGRGPSEGSIVLLFLFLLVIYVLIYNRITKCKPKRIFTILTFVGTLLMVYGYIYVIDRPRTVTYQEEDVESISIEYASNYAFKIGEDLIPISNSSIKTELLHKIMQNQIEHEELNSTEEQEDSYTSDRGSSTFFMLVINMKDHRSIRENITLTKEETTWLLQELAKDEHYQKRLKEEISLQAIGIDYEGYFLKVSPGDAISKALTSLKENYPLKDYLDKDNGRYNPSLTLYTYKDYKLKEITLSLKNYSKEESLILEAINRKTQKELSSNLKKDNLNYLDIDIIDKEENNEPISFDKIDLDKMFSYIEAKDPVVDSSKPYLVICMVIDNRQYFFYSNDITSFEKEILNKD